MNTSRTRNDTSDSRTTNASSSLSNATNKSLPHKRNSSNINEVRPHRRNPSNINESSMVSEHLDSINTAIHNSVMVSNSITTLTNRNRTISRNNSSVNMHSATTHNECYKCLLGCLWIFIIFCEITIGILYVLVYFKVILNDNIIKWTKFAIKDIIVIVQIFNMFYIIKRIHTIASKELEKHRKHGEQECNYYQTKQYDSYKEIIDQSYKYFKTEMTSITSSLTTLTQCYVEMLSQEALNIISFIISVITILINIIYICKCRCFCLGRRAE